MNIKNWTVVLLVYMVLITIPIVWFIRQASGVLTFLTPIIILGNLVIANIIFHKTSCFKPFQDNLLHRARRTQNALASGLVTILVMGIITQKLIHPSDDHFMVYSAIFFVVGTIMGYTLQRTW